MRDALEEARDYRDGLDIDEAKGHLSYDEWLKKVKSIAKGAHGINSDEHAKYSAEWRAYVKGLFDDISTEEQKTTKQDNHPHSPTKRVNKQNKNKNPNKHNKQNLHWEPTQTFLQFSEQHIYSMTLK